MTDCSPGVTSISGLLLPRCTPLPPLRAPTQQLAAGRDTEMCRVGRYLVAARNGALTRSKGQGEEQASPAIRERVTAWAPTSLRKCKGAQAHTPQVHAPWVHT